MSSESQTTSTSVAPSAAARSRPSSKPRYSATLFVASPIRTAARSSTCPSGAETTAAAAAGPGLPRAPPSTWTTTCTAASLVAVRRRGDRGELSRHAGAPPVTDLAHPAARGSGLAPLGSAAVDDHGDVRIVLVIPGETGVELLGEGLGDDAVDHASDATPGPEPCTSFIRPAGGRYALGVAAARCSPPRSSAAAFTACSPGSSSLSSVPW